MAQGDRTWPPPHEPMPVRVLIVEDCEADAELEANVLTRAGIECVCDCVETREDCLSALDRTAYDLILADYTLPSFSGLQAVRLVRERGLDTPTILVSGTVGEEIAIECLKTGATDYVLKTRLDRLGPVAVRALREAEERRHRARAEEALSETEAKLATVFHEGLDAILLIEPHSGRILHANRAVERLLKFRPDDLVGRPMDVLQPQHPATSHEQLLVEIQVHGPVFAQLDVRRADGSTCLMDLTATLSAWGKQTLIIATLRDVTELREAENARHEEHAISTALARVGHELIGALDDPDPLSRLCRLTVEVLECDATFAFLRDARSRHFDLVASHGATPGEQQLARSLAAATDAMAALLGRVDATDATEVGPLPASVVSPAEQQAHRFPAQLVMALRRGTEIIGVQIAVNRSRPEPFTPRHRRIAQGLAQQASLVLAHVRGVEELARVNRLKSDFVATISHELRTPLSVILGYTDLLADGAYGPVTAEQQDTLQRLYRGACTLRELVNETLDLSRLEAGELALDPKLVALGDVLRELSEDMQLAEAKPGVTVTWDIPPGLPALTTDPEKLKLVLKNLVANAIKFTDAGEVTVSATPQEGGCLVTVADTGPGIAPAALPFIFDAFRQADASRTRRHGGVGLGLYIVRRLLDLLGGRITVDSVVGHGSTFRVYLPGGGNCR